MSSSQSNLDGQMTRATVLEAQLAALPKKSADYQQKASGIRIQLCEVLSDVMLTDPQFALRRDCSGRLWRNCFYNRIVELRSLISRETRKQGPSLPKLKESLQVFLKEAIVLYNYLVEKYESKLLPPDSQESEDEISTDGVVPGLHRILIHSGDLYRYSQNYSRATKCYENASKLAPGKGNPYNQLAVVAQLKDPSAPLDCVALYFYARSLLATHDPFDTSKGNLERLMKGNRDWLQKSSEQELLKKVKGDRARAIKTVQSRLFLARFVDLHYDFFHSKLMNDDEVVEKMEVVLTKLEGLLKEWAFGDALLVKMVAINAFSVHWTRKRKSNVNLLARAFTFRFGAALAERLEQGLKKALEKNTTSVRLLLPLLLLCDYVSTLPDMISTKELDAYDNSQVKFWTGIAGVATRLSSMDDSLGNVSDKQRPKEYDSLVGFAPFESFIESNVQDGYVSVEEAIDVLELNGSTGREKSGQENSIKLERFHAFVETSEHLQRTAGGEYRVAAVEQDALMDDNDENLLVDDDQMVEFDSMDPPTIPAKEGNVQAEEEDVLVYKQSENGQGPALLVPGALLLNASSPTKKKAQSVGAQSTTDASPARAVPHFNPPAAATLSPPRPVEVPVVPTGPTTSLGPPFPTATAQPPLGLPLPTAMAQPPLGPQLPTATAQPPLAPPPGIRPPPGFGSPAAAPSLSAPPQQQQQQLPPHMQSFAAQTSVPPMAVGGPPGYSQQQQHAIPQDSDGDTVLDMLRGVDVYSSSANPFLVPPPAPGLFPAQNQDHDMDGSSLLDSSLLSSMLMDDSTQAQSKNPFLT